MYNATKWHYFVEGRSLCQRWMLLSTKDLQSGKDESPDNCVKCKKLLKERKSQLGQVTK
jgi:hypothetical protein